jgi:hypothetical protein
MGVLPVGERQENHTPTARMLPRTCRSGSPAESVACLGVHRGRLLRREPPEPDGVVEEDVPLLFAREEAGGLDAFDRELERPGSDHLVRAEEHAPAEAGLDNAL